jgi:hypothetical protein
LSGRQRLSVQYTLDCTSTAPVHAQPALMASQQVHCLVNG